MSASSPIEWTHATWNPTTGCDKISPGCDHCYALTLARRLKAMGQAKYQHDGDPRTSGPGFGVTVHQDAIGEPLRWRTPRLVFVNSMSDIGHARVSTEAIARIWAVMALARRHTFQVLTKRPKRLATLLSDPTFAGRVREQAAAMAQLRPLAGPGTAASPGDRATTAATATTPWPLANVWVGTSIETGDYSWRADVLRQIPAATRFLSLEPLLGPLPHLSFDGIDWVIAGGESGPGHRPLDLAWARDIRDRCARQNVAFFFKQIGGPTPKAGGRHLDGRTWDQMPELATVDK